MHVNLKGHKINIPFVTNIALNYSGLLHGVKWFETDVSGLHIGPEFKGQVVRDTLTLEDGNDSLTLEDGTDSLTLVVGTDRWYRIVGFNLPYAV